MVSTSLTAASLSTPSDRKRFLWVSVFILFHVVCSFCAYLVDTGHLGAAGKLFLAVWHTASYSLAPITLSQYVERAK